MEQCRRKLEIGSCRERLDAVREVGSLHSREAYELLELAARDVDGQVREEARRFMQESCWYSGIPMSDAPRGEEEHRQDSLF